MIGLVVLSFTDCTLFQTSVTVLPVIWSDCCWTSLGLYFCLYWVTPPLSTSLVLFIHHWVITHFFISPLTSDNSCLHHISWYQSPMPTNSYSLVDINAHSMPTNMLHTSPKSDPKHIRTLCYTSSISSPKHRASDQSGPKDSSESHLSKHQTHPVKVGNLTVHSIS